MKKFFLSVATLLSVSTLASATESVSEASSWKALAAASKIFTQPGKDANKRRLQAVPMKEYAADEQKRFHSYKKAIETNAVQKLVAKKQAEEAARLAVARQETERLKQASAAARKAKHPKAAAATVASHVTWVPTIKNPVMQNLIAQLTQEIIDPNEMLPIAAYVEPEGRDKESPKLFQHQTNIQGLETDLDVYTTFVNWPTVHESPAVSLTNVNLLDVHHPLYEAGVGSSYTNYAAPECFFGAQSSETTASACSVSAATADAGAATAVNLPAVSFDKTEDAAAATAVKLVDTSAESNTYKPANATLLTSITKPVTSLFRGFKALFGY